MNENFQKNTETTKIISKTTQSLNDENLYNLCKRYGEMTLRWRRKFAGLLPEVNRRKLYEKKGFSSIFMFAEKLAGMSEPQVRLAVNLEKRFEKTPILKELLVDGKVSVNKLARVASIATSENEEFLAGQLKLLSNRAVETLVRDIKFENQNGLFEPKIDRKNMHVQMLNLSSEVVEKLTELQNKGIDINELILKFLQKRELEIEEGKKKISEEIEIKNHAGTREEQTLKTTQKSTSKITVTRYIPSKIKKIIHREHGTKCSIPHCQKPAQTLHHTQRFALSKNHDPHFIAPLCHEHHLIAHSIDVNFHGNRSR